MIRFNQLKHLGLLAILVGATIGSINLADGQSQAPTLDRPAVPSVGDIFTYRWNNEIVAFTYIGRNGDLNSYSTKVSSARQSTVCRTSEDNTVRRSAAGNPEPLILTTRTFLSPCSSGNSGSFRTIGEVMHLLRRRASTITK